MKRRTPGEGAGEGGRRVGYPGRRREGKKAGRTAGNAVGGDEDREGHGARAEREDEQAYRGRDEEVSAGASRIQGARASSEAAFSQ